MFKARPPSGNSLEAVPTRRTALPAARLLAVLAALALAAFLSGVLPVQGQTATVLVKNTGQTLTTFNAPLNNDGQKRAQAFTTGSEAAGYALSSIGFRFKDVAETAAASKLTATLAAESSGDPGSTLCTLTNPTITANAVNTFTAPTSCPILAANTTYFFVLERSDPSGNSIGVNLTSSGNQDSTPATGWSISDDRHQGSSTGPWNHTSGESYLIEVKGPEVRDVAEAGTALVKNTGQTSGSPSQLNTDFPKAAQEFTTGTSMTGWRLSSIGISFDKIGDTSTAGSELTVTLNEMVTVTVQGVGFEVPGNALCTLTDPASFSATGVHTFDAPSTDPCPTLSASTDYFVVLARANNNTDAIFYGVVSGDDEDTGAATGWSIGDYSDFFQSATNVWSPSINSMQIEVKGAVMLQANATATGLPTVSGTAQEGNALGADVSGIGDGNGIPADVVYSYRWQADGVDITGAEAATYWLAASDIGKRISVEVTFTDSGGFVETLTSARTATVTDDPTLTVNWSVTMTAGVDTDAGVSGYGTLASNVANALGSVSPGSFTSDGDPYTVHGVFYDDSGGVGEFFLVLSAELSGVFDLVRDGITLKSTAALVSTQTNENKRHRWSTGDPNWTDGQKVAFAIREHVDFPPTGQVTIDGTFAENEVLTANTSAIEDANGLTGVSYSYQWGRSNCTDSANDSDISGATGSTRTLTATDVT